MYSAAILAIALSVLLITGGCAFLISAARARREAVAARIQLIALPGSKLALRPASTDALMRQTNGKIHPSELQEILRFCRAWGIQDRLAAASYGWFRVACAAALALIGLVAASVMLRGSSLPIKLLVGAAFGGVGWVAPAMVIARLAKRHAAAAAAGLSEALELMVVCVGAGLSLEDAIDRITGDLKWSRPALAEELMLTSAELKILPDRDIALNNLAERIDAPSVRSVVTALSQTLRYGTPLAQALRLTASELRNDSLLLMEERANRLPTLLTLPMMLFIMPTVFIIIGGPAVLKLMDMFAKKG